MNELCNNFSMYSISDVQYWVGNTVTFKADASPINLFAEKIDLSPVGSTGNSGTLYTINTELVIDKVPSDVAVRYQTPRKSILVFSKTTGEKIVIGSSAFLALVSITTLLDKDKLTILSKSLKSPL